ncbi:TPA: 1-(5-phosphoribosyl)-5-[(5-phosphoribosylamino)methylideneamino]imidazole-4-carboxamide isomerase [Candidatus Bathyarchaeota archaeon]|nr:1-(5-phosphoribosyl)-5-[(5-phosphoribosylamino)methylideneamino]imidazole-4-carboxamide isomerase [Candidatus Bathyarchaeota archaeon]
MEIIPAVDIMNGEVVRLVRGDPKAKISYSHLGDPVSLAVKWSKEGADLIHIIDLDAALEIGSNRGTILRILRTVNIPVQVGGGIRTLKTAQDLLEEGVERVILGSLAFKESRAVEKLIEEYGKNRVVIALDHLKGEVMIKGWKESTDLTVIKAIQKFLDYGANLFLVTSVLRDGTMIGSDIKTLKKTMERYPNVRLIAAGGIRSIDDIVSLNRIGIHGVVIGRALYDRIFTLREIRKYLAEGE